MQRFVLLFATRPHAWQMNFGAVTSGVMTFRSIAHAQPFECFFLLRHPPVEKLYRTPLHISAKAPAGRVRTTASFRSVRLIVPSYLLPNLAAASS